MNYLVFEIRRLRYGIAIDFLERIIERQQAVYPVPLVPAFITGILNYQGRVITAVDIGEFLNDGEVADKRYILISKEMNNIGYLVKNILGFIELDSDKLEDVGKFDLDKEKKEFISYLAEGADGSPISIVDIEKVERHLKNQKNWSKHYET